ncbi:MAG: outer membrane beta-barrel protein, partial [Ekhidna sp.]
LMMPIMFGHHFGLFEEEGFFIKGGVFLSYLLQATYKVPDNSLLLIPDPKKIDNIDEFNRLDFGISLGTGIDWEHVGLELRANWGLRNLNNNPSDIWQYVDTSNEIYSVLYQLSLNVMF